jgi:hypothetical protein
MNKISALLVAVAVMIPLAQNVTAQQLGNASTTTQTSQPSYLCKWVTTQYGGYCAASPVKLTAAQQQEVINTRLAVQAEYQQQQLLQQQAVPAASDETPARPAKHHGFKNAMINALHGAGQAGQQYAQQPHPTVTCTTQQFGNTAYTTCQ